jgi:hypothetical protein
MILSERTGLKNTRKIFITWFVGKYNELATEAWRNNDIHLQFNIDYAEAQNQT